MADILLTHSYILDLDHKQKRIGQPISPLGTLYAAALLKEKGFPFAFYDPMFTRGPEEIVPVMEKEHPRVLVIYDDGFSYLSKMCLGSMKNVAGQYASVGHKYGATVILSSWEANDHYDQFLENGVDYVILGEAELTLAELAGAILNGNRKSVDEINGLAFKKNGETKITAPRQIMDNPDDLPFPAWDLLDAEAYRKAWKSKNRDFSLSMVTTRGCPYNCIWCAKPVYGNHYNSRSPLSVAKEMAYLQEKLKPDHIWFADDIFGLKPSWTEEFAGQVRLLGVNVPFSIQSRVDLLLENNQVPSLAKAGCRKIWLGIESGSRKILDAMHKGITVEQVRAVSPLLRKSGIEQAFFIQLGFPGETKEDIRKTIRLLTELMPDDIGISVTYPMPGTKFYDSVKAEMNGKSGWEDSDDLTLLFKSTYSSGYYKVLHRYIHKYFRFRQAAFYFGEVLTKPDGMTGKKLRRVLLLPYYLAFAIIYRIILALK